MCIHYRVPLFLMLLTAATGLFNGCNEAGTGSPTFLSNTSPTSADGSVNSGLNGFGNFKSQPSVQKLIYHVGPADLNAKQPAAQMLENPQTLKFQVSEPMWITGFKPKVVDSEGNALSGKLLYKAIVFNKQESNPLCSSGNTGNPFAAATSTLTAVELPEGFGYPLMPNESLEARVVFQNPTDQELTGVLFSFELEAIPMDKAKGYHDIKAVLLDTDPCEHKPLALEPGAFVEKSQTFSMPVAGQLMVANGILSDYGVSVALTHQSGSNISVVPFWRASATLDEAHSIINLEDNPFFDPVGKSIQSGDKLTLGVAFDNFSEEWQNEATGSAMVYIAPRE